MANSPQGQNPVEGEGNRTADRNYRKGVADHIKKGTVEAEADAAKKALENTDQREELEAAEEAARKGKTLKTAPPK